MNSSCLLKSVVRVAMISVLLVIAPELSAQGTISDYKRAMDLQKTTRNKVFKQRIAAHWFLDNKRFWYRNDLPDNKREFILINAESGERNSAFDHGRFASSLGKATGEDVAADSLPIDRLQFMDQGKTILFTSKHKKWKCDLRTYKLEKISDDREISGALQPGNRVRASQSGGEETFVTFLNRSKGDIKLYWIDLDAGRNFYKNLKKGEQHKQHTYAGHVWLATDKTEKRVAVYLAKEDHKEAVITEKSLKKPAEVTRSKTASRDKRGSSPDGRWRAFVRNHNLILKDLKKNSETELSKDCSADDRYHGIYWSPDSRKVVAMRVKKGEDHKIHLIESSPKAQVQPKLHTLFYRKPGDRIDLPAPHLFDVKSKRQINIKHELFPNPWSISQLRWSADSKGFTFLYNQRGHQVLRIISVDAATGKSRAIVNEESKTFIDYAGKLFISRIAAVGEIIWMSERDGYNHLYLYDSKTGRVKNQITKGSYVVRSVEHVDESNRRIFFYGSGVRPEQNPYYMHYCAVDFNGSNFIVMTEGDGSHKVSISPDRKYFIDNWSRVDQPPRIELRSAKDGSLICELEQADWSPLLKTGWRPPELFTAKGRDGQTDIYGFIIRPSNFDPNRNYPVIEEIYAGPHTASTPKSFGLMNRQHAIAELGFIVVHLDGMGTSHRSKAFHDICWKNLGDAGFPDQIAGTRAAAKKYRYIDTSRVGIYGGSAGGQNALRALLAHGDFYKVAVSDCGCHDNRMDKIWWNELWMGWPVGPHYNEQSNVTMAHKLTGKLLLTVGELDRNVDPASTMQVVDALIKADKDFDLLIVPGRGHGVGEIPYASRRRMDFFVRHLLGIQDPEHSVDLER